MKKNNYSGYLYILPACLVIAVFILYPLIKTIFMSFYMNYDFLNNTVTGFGMDNYQYLMQDRIFWRALRNTLLYVVFVVPCSIMISLGIAVLLNSKIKFRGFFQTVFFLPYVTSVVAVGIVWGWIFHSKYGLVNGLLQFFGIPGVEWLNRPVTAMAALIIFSIWKSLAFNIIIFLAGLQNIQPIYYQAAKVDATPKGRVFLKITVPMLSPMILYTMVMGLISGFKVYDEVYALFGGKAGPADSAITLVYYIYNKFYSNWDFGVASAAAVFLFLLILFLTIFQLRVSKKKVFY